MNRLRIVVEESGPGVYEVKYVGRDAVEAQKVLREATPNYRALFQYPKISKWNRPVKSDQPEIPANETNLAEGETEEAAGETDLTDDAAEAVEAPARAPRAPRAARAPRGARK